MKTIRRFGEKLWLGVVTFTPRRYKRRIVHSLLTPRHRITGINIKKRGYEIE